MKRLLVFGAAVVMLAQTPAPKIPPELEAEYYRADGAVAHVKPAWDAANSDLQAAALALQKACGEKHQPQMDGKHLVCVAKPEPVKPEPVKPESPKK